MKSLLTLLSVAFLLCLNTVSGQQRPLEMDDLMNPKLYSKTLQNLQWIDKGDDFSWIDGNTLIKQSARPVKGKQQDTLLTLDQLNTAIEALGLEKTKRFPAITWGTYPVFTFVYKNRLLQYTGPGKPLIQINQWNEKAGNLDIDPISGKAAFTMENNLYYADGGHETFVTRDTDKTIVNGSERVHRNEWGIEKGTFWSPTGKALAFYRMDESMVADYPLVDIDSRIATVENSKYPMAGEKSHEVTLGVYHLASGKTVFMKTGEPRDQFLAEVTWTPDEKFILIAILNRAQNHLKLQLFDATTGEMVRMLFEEKNDRYVEPMNPPVFLKKNPNLFLWQSRRDGYNHIYLYNLEGMMQKQITSGSWEVMDFLGLDPAEKKIFYHASMNTPLERHLYEADINSGKFRRLTDVNARHNTFVNGKGSFFIDQYSAVGIPSRYVVYNSNGKLMQSLTEGENPLKDIIMGETRLLRLAAEDGTPLYARMILPPGFDSLQKYPAIVYVYGGPHSQLVTNSWLGGANLYLNYLASQGYIVFTLDNRGTANRGFAFESIIHRHLGDTEVADQMTGVSYLKSRPYVDGSRLGVEGWSYGGFMTISLMLKKPDVFKVGICGGPVIDWKYYEVMYGERYMDTPQENPEGYAASSLLNGNQELTGRLLVIHGTMDATVVWQNSLAFIQKCIKDGVQPDYFVYPGHGHGVGGKDRIHLYRKQVRYYKDFL